MEQIGRYQIQGELGRGAMGIVYRALDPAIGRIIAIKTIHLSTLADPQDRERLHDRLRREAQSAGILSHPNIVTIYDIQDHGDTAYIFMEFVDGPTLESITSDRRAPSPATLLALLKQIAAALDFAHSKGIIHRDIKPANIMIQGERFAKVTDFGIARINAQASVSRGATVAGTLLGTPNYMSPEQIQGDAVDGRTDQFAFGVLTYELLTGEKPFSADSIPALIYKIINQDAPLAERINASLHPDVGAVLARAIAKDRTRRFATCVEFVEALEKALDRQPQWQPLPRGASNSAPTVVGQHLDATVMARPVLSILELPAPRPRPDRALNDTERQKGGRLLKYAAIAAGIAVAIAAGIIFWAQNTDFSTPPPKTAIEEISPGDRSQPNGPPQIPPVQPAAEIKPPDATLSETKVAETKVAETKVPETKLPETRAPEPTTQPQSDGLQLYPVSLKSQPDGATAVLENGRGCRTPCEIQVPAGRHTATFTAEGFTAITQRFEVPKQDSVMARLDANTGTVYLDSTPSGAAIRVDGKDVSVKTPTTLTLPAGRHKLEFSKDGYASQQHEVDVSDGAISKLSIRWSEKK